MKKIKTLLSKGTSNAKTVKNEIPSFILYLSPFTTNNKGINICPNASPGCVSSCLFTAGFAGVYHSVNEARQRKTEYYLSDKKAFCGQLYTELKRISDKGIKTAIRLNGTSDLDFIAIIKNQIGMDVLNLPNLIFYDYTKIIGKAIKYKGLKNYFVTFSRSEKNEKDCLAALNSGINVAVVFDHKKDMPKKYLNTNVVNGDSSDIIMINNNGVILGLKAKGKAKKDITGFVVR